MIVIVGGAGFLGSHLRNRLAATTSEEIVIVTRATSVHPRLPNETQIALDDFDSPAGDDLLRRASTIVYLATVSTVATFVDRPWQELSGNVDPFMRLLHRLVNLNPACKIVLVSSGGAIYGLVSGLEPIREDHPTRPISPYGLGKLMQEEALAFASRTSGLGFNILRIANPVGVHGRSLSQGLVTAALRAVANGQPMTLYGDGSHVRDILDADDAADAMVAAISDQRLCAHTWNVGSGIGLSNRQVLDMVERVTGAPVPLRRLPPRVSDVERIVLDTALIFADLGWQAKRDVEATIAAIWCQNFESAKKQYPV